MTVAKSECFAILQVWLVQAGGVKKRKQEENRGTKDCVSRGKDHSKDGSFSREGRHCRASPKPEAPIC